MKIDFYCWQQNISNLLGYEVYSDVARISGEMALYKHGAG